MASRKVLLVWWWTAREHIIAEKLKKNPDTILFAFWPKNPWIEDLAAEMKVWALNDFQAIVDFAKEKDVDWAFIWPDNPIWEWLADALLYAWIKSFAPLKSLARLESSKWFTRNLLTKYWIEWNPLYKVFEWKPESNKKEISKFLDELWWNFVVKYDALLWWKWVKLSWEHLKNNEEWLNYALECLQECWRVVIEEKLEWEEFSLICFADWVSLVTMPTIQDHKRAYDWDVWPNTWWMGTYSHESWVLPFLNTSDVAKARDITVRIMKSLEDECWWKYKWLMYWGFIAVKNWVRVIEYNARFWDPEVMNLLMLLKTDLVTICEAVINERLQDINIEFDHQASVCKYVAPDGYPTNPLKWEKVELWFDYKELEENCKIYFWSVTRNEKWELIMWTSRAIAVAAKANSINEANELVDNLIKKISWRIFYRKDIWTEGLIQKRIDHMKKIRKG